MAWPNDEHRQYYRIRLWYNFVFNFPYLILPGCQQGFFPLAELPIIRLLGGTQFRKFCVIVIVVLVATVWITCACHEEEERPKARRPQREYVLTFISRTICAELRARNFRDVINNIYTAAITLPKPIRRVCYVQLVAFLAWSVIHIFVS